MIHVVGIGLNGAEGLTSSTLELIAQAKILAGGDRHLSYFPQYGKKSLVIKDFSADLKKIKQFHQTLKSHETIVVLASGDPLYFGLGRLLLEKFSPEQLFPPFQRGMRGDKTNHAIGVNSANSSLREARN